MIIITPVIFFIFFIAGYLADKGKHTALYFTLALAGHIIIIIIIIIIGRRRRRIPVVICTNASSEKNRKRHSERIPCNMAWLKLVLNEGNVR